MFPHSAEKEELDRALHALLDAIHNLNFGEAQTEADQGESSSQGASSKEKGKAKDPNPDWEDVPYNPVPITPLSARPRFAQVVGSSSETPVVPPSSLAASIMANAVPHRNPPPPVVLPYATGDQFRQLWNAAANDDARIALEQQALNHSLIQDVQFAAMMKVNQRLQNQVGQLAGQVNAATAAAQAAGNVDRFRPAAPPKFGAKKGGHVLQWIPLIEDYFRNAPDADFLRLASSYLEGGPRSLWTTVYEAYKDAHAQAEPPNPREYFRETLVANYGLQDLDQKFWDTWNGLKQGPSQDIAEYNVAFQQALTDLAGHVTDEQIKIEKYRSGLIKDLQDLCRASPDGGRWANLAAIIRYATLQWPVVQERIAKRKKQSEPTKVAGKRKASGGGAGGSGRSSVRARLGATGGLSEEQKRIDFEKKLCHKCHQPNHQAKNCPLNRKGKAAGKVAAASGSRPDDNMESDDEDF